MKPRPEDLLQTALEAAARGQEIDGILAGLSREEAGDLRALMAAATAAGSMGRSEVPSEAARRSRSRLLRRVAAMPPTVTTRPRLWGLMPRFSAATLVALVALALGLGGLNEAAAISLPGDILYPVKVAAADLRLRLEFEAGQRLRLESLYAEQRLEDVRRLLALGRKVPVSFHGQVQAIGTVLWQVQEIPVRLTHRTRVIGEILPGMLIEVEGITQADGTVLADELHLESYDMLGTLEALDADRMTVDGRTFLLTPRSVLEPGLAVGHRVLVRVAIDDAGTRSVVSAVRFSPPTPTAAPSPTATTAPTRLPPPPSTSTPAASPTDDHSGPGGGTPGPGEDDDGATETPATQDEGEDDDEESEKIEFEGVVQSIAGSQWVVDGRTIRVDGQTEVNDNPGVGDTIKVVAFLQSDGTWWAEKVELED
jgi:hypothetical protein